jgi:predicted ATPase/DNA-binding SARP family transcriptional activator
MQQRRVTIRLLGDFAIEIEGRPVRADAWRLRKAADLVKLLALAPGHRLHRDQFMETLWPDKPPGPAANNLYQAIHVARKALGGSDGSGADVGDTILEFRDGVLSLGPAERLTVDTEAFEDAVRRADAGEIAAREEARSLYRGELLPDDRYEDWAATPRETLAAAHRHNLSELARLYAAEGNLEAALGSLRALIELDPTDEAAAGRIMRLEARAGRRGAAHQQYEALRGALRRELNVEPGEEVTRLARDIIDGRLDPLGERPSTSNIPAQFTSFIGRQRELREVQRLLLASRLLTLTGTGGTGKTRLALEAAHGARGAYLDGVWLVELAAVRHRDGVTRAVAETFGVREAPGVPLLEAIANQLGTRRLLLVLDNCEHLVDTSAALADRLRLACPNLRILATSRQPLRSRGEVLFRVPSLPVPDPDEPLSLADLALVDSVRLFADRARAIDPTFEVTLETAAPLAKLCFHLDGLPLAIELAASRIVGIPVATLVDRLEQRFDLLVGGSRTALTRQQTLRATIDWSYDLLSEPQQAVLRAMSVFAGRTSPEAVEAVCGHVGLGSGGALLSILGELVDQSLLVLDTTAGLSRFRLLDTVREYALERLADSEDRPRVEEAQIAWAVDFATRTAAALPGDRWADGFRSLGIEHDSLRAALDRALLVAPDQALTLVERLWPFWLWDGRLVEGRRWLERALEGRTEQSAARGTALLGLAALIGRAGDPVEHARVAGEAVAIFRELGDAPSVCRALALRGCAAWVMDDLDTAASVFGSGLDAATEAGFESGRGAAESCLAVVAHFSGDDAAARRRIDAALAAFRAAEPGEPTTLQVLDLGEMILPEPATGGHRLVFQETFGSFREVRPPTAAAYAMGNRGMLARVLGNLDDAEADLEASLAEFQAMGDERGAAQALGRLGNLAAQRGELGAGRQLLGECLEIRRRLGDSRGVSLTESNLGVLETLAGRFERAEELLTRAIDAFRRRADGWGIASALANLGSLALARKNPIAARGFLEEGLIAAKATRRPRWVAWRLLELAAVASVEGDSESAASRRAEAAAIFGEIGDAPGAMASTRDATAGIRG